MIDIKSDYPLIDLNTFGIPAKAKYFAQVHSQEDLIALLQTIEARENKLFPLGGGSNVLFTKDVEALVIHNNITGIELLHEDENEVLVKSGGGIEWHDFVMYAIEQGWAGLENLSLIPGKIGTAPIQNIGAYGVELKDVFEELTAVDLQTGELRVFTKDECEFGYRSSVFKTHLKGKYFITEVTFRLSKKPQFNISYGAISEILAERGVTKDSLTIKDVSDAVIEIRQSKLPDPRKIGNGGSFFKNPTIPTAQYQQLKEQFPDMPAYKVNEQEVKVPAGWLIDQSGWKGYRIDNIGVHDKQALVLVNFGGNNGSKIRDLAFRIQKSIQETFGIEISPEVNIY